MEKLIKLMHTRLHWWARLVGDMESNRKAGEDVSAGAMQNTCVDIYTG